jgi:hypothetical protein
MERNTSLTFYSALNHSDIGKTFCNYLKKQNKEETWKFIVSCQLLEIFIQKSNKKRASAQIEQILTKYFIEENSILLETQLMKKKFLQIMEMKKTETLDEIYPFIFDLKNIILPIYKNFYFQNFTHTKEARELCETYKNQKLLVIHLSKEYQVTDADFECKEIKKRDIDYMKKLENEDPSDWLQTYSNDYLKLYQSYQHHLHDVKFLELPVVFRTQGIFNGNLQETAIGTLHKFLQHDSVCVFFKVIDYNDRQFIVDQYVKRPPGNVRVRRLVCTLKFENGSIFAIMKPLKIPDKEFLKFIELKYVKEGEEVIERGVQDFYYSALRISPLNEHQSNFSSVSILDGRFGISGVPIDLLHQKSAEFYKQFVEGIKKNKGKKISDFKEMSNEMKDGLPLDPFAKMLFDMNIDQYESKNQEKKLIINILENINIHNERTNSQVKEENFMENISSSTVILDVKSNILNQKISFSREETSLTDALVQNEFLDNISKNILKNQKNSLTKEEISPANLNFFSHEKKEISLGENQLDDGIVIDELQSIFNHIYE